MFQWWREHEGVRGFNGVQKSSITIQCVQESYGKDSNIEQTDTIMHTKQVL